MRRRLNRLWFTYALGSVIFWGSPASRAAEPNDAAVTAGQQLAAELRNQRPSEGSTNSAILRLRDKTGRRSSVGVTIQTILGDGSWEARYLAGKPTNEGASRAVIHHRKDATPRYEIAQAADGGATRPAVAGQADISLAGSDFWISDLALEFLHWPQQRILRSEPSSGRMCQVLESVNPGTNGYARVVSWIDAKYDALLNAEAYDRAGQVVKRFNTGSFRKILRPDGQEIWFLQDVKISDRRRGTVTELNFEPPDSK